MSSRRHAPAALTSGKSTGTYCTGGWVGFGSVLDGGEKYILPAPGLRTKSSSLQRAAVSITPFRPLIHEVRILNSIYIGALMNNLAVNIKLLNSLQF